MSTKLTKVIANFETQLTAKLSAGITTLNGTSTGTNTTNTINDTTKSWTVNQYAGYKITILSGTGAGQTFYITSNTATQVTITGNWSVIPDATSVYQLKVSSATLLSATDKDGVALPAGRYCFALDLGNSLEEHIIADLNGTTLKNIESVSRQGVKTDGAGKEHRVGCKVKLTDFVNLKVLVDLLSGADTLDSTTPLAYDAEPTLNDRKQLATVGLVQDVVTGAVGTATPTNSGTIKSTHNQGTKPRAMSTLVREQNTPDLTLLVGAFKHAELDKNISFTGGNSPQFINPGFAGDLSIALNPGNTETFTLVINGTTCTFNFVTSIGATPGNILIGASAAATRANLAAFINNPGATSATQVAFTGAQLTALGYVTAIDDLSLNIFIKATSASLTSMSGAETMAGAGNIWTANTTKNRIDLLVLETTGSTLQIRRGTEALSPVAVTPTSGDIVLAQVFCKTGMTAVKDVDDTINGYIANWYFPQVFRTDVSLSASFPVYENLVAGDIIKTYNDSGNFKAAKLIGRIAATSSTASVNGSINYAEVLNSTQLVVGTTTGYFYLADWDGIKITGLTAFSAPSGSLQAIAVLDTQTVILSSVSANIWSVRTATISGQTIAYGTAITKTPAQNYGGVGGSSFLRVSATMVMFFDSEPYASNYSYKSLMISPITITGGALSIGATQTVYAGQYRQGAYLHNCVRLSDTSFLVTTMIQSEDSGTNRQGFIMACSLSGSTLTLGSNTVISSGTNSQTFSSTSLRISDTRALVLLKQLSASDVLSGYYITVSGTTVTLGAEITTSGVLASDGFVAFINGQFITLKRSSDNKMFLIRFIKEVPNLSNISSSIYSDINYICQSLAEYLITFSTDAASKVGKILLDHELFIGIADKNYYIGDNFSVTSIYRYAAGGLSVGGIYYLNDIGNGLSFLPYFKKVGRAISDSVIIKE